MDVRLVVRYHHALWRRFADFYVESCDWAVLSENHETSHQSIANVTMHAVNMEDWWLHYVLAGRAWDGPAWDGFEDASAMRDRVVEVEEKTRRLLDGATAADLARPRRIASEGVEGERTLEEILLEVMGEATHHRGEVIAMLWRRDITPPYVGYLDWLDEQAAPAAKRGGR